MILRSLTPIALLTLFLTLLLGGCSGPAGHEEDVQPPQGTPPLTGTTWELVSFAERGEEGSPSELKGEYLVEFVSDTGMVATPYCNECGGKYEAGPGDKLTVSSLWCTRQACGKAEDFPYAMRRATRYVADSTRLWIFYKDVITKEDMTLVFASSDTTIAE